MASTPRHLILGCGYVGARLARALLPAGSVLAVTRGADSATRLTRLGLDARTWDLDAPVAAAPRGLGRPAVVFYLVPPPREGTTDPRIRTALASLAAPSRFVYLSSTAVYSGCELAEVDEDTPVAPTNERGQRRLDAETQVRAWAERVQVPYTILRVPAIYGPGRLPLDSLKRGDPMIRHSEARPSSRIHVDDLVAACLVVANAAQARNRLYTVSDGTSASMTEYFERVATLVGLPGPALLGREEASRVLAPGILSFLNESRRVSNQRIRRELGFAPRFADLRLGILSCLPPLTSMS
jgi:nucleoside-diphosphate-sugar epimerase